MHIYNSQFLIPSFLNYYIILHIEFLRFVMQNLKLIRQDIRAPVHMMRELFLYIEMMQLVRRRQKIVMQ